MVYTSLLLLLYLILLSRQPILRCNSKVRSMVSHVVRSNLFFWFMILIIFTNFVLLAADHYPVSPDISKTICKFLFSHIFSFVYCSDYKLCFYINLYCGAHSKAL